MSKIQQILNSINEESEDSYYSVSNQMKRTTDFDDAVNKILNFSEFNQKVYPKLELKNKSFISSLVPMVRNILLEVANYMHELEVDDKSIDSEYRKAVIGEISGYINDFKKANKA